MPRIRLSSFNLVFITSYSIKTVENVFFQKKKKEECIKMLKLLPRNLTINFTHVYL